MHSRQGARLRVVDLDDSGMGMRAVEHFGVEHVAHFDVVDKGRQTFRQLYGVDLALRLADHLGFRDVGTRNHLGCERREVERIQLIGSAATG